MTSASFNFVDGSQLGAPHQNCVTVSRGTHCELPSSYARVAYPSMLRPSSISPSTKTAVVSSENLPLLSRKSIGVPVLGSTVVDDLALPTEL